ncbi:hypothetical protein GCM10010885_22420 [Alicyclobacillus cellulosilyticus]|uniref:Uncharacterized protein n=1 Tax=Alicyclobacillus cellulosilyticus TaxID=1003997 RepID=A0A917NP79_9BACL|nr:hypothetical protein [Alicyclobacillus cellulosilyticus]GGJ12559.1 hypothetical protein GCM10010885_22420 [Alicyclobacillus cellulosilyticus]
MRDKHMHHHPKHEWCGEPHTPPRHAGPQTFRRGRAIAFLEILNVRRATLLRQLEQPEFASIRPMLTGELKAIETVRDEFIAMFDLAAAADASAKGETGGAKTSPPAPQGLEQDAPAAGEHGAASGDDEDLGENAETNA